MGNSKGKSDKSFLQTLPGIITSIAALITAIGGCIAVIFGIPAITNVVFRFTPTPPATQTVSPPVDIPTQTISSPPVDIPTPADIQPTETKISENPTEPPTLSLPTVFDFQTCESQCTGQNSSRSFPEGTKKIYAQFNYANFPPGANYVRTWSLNGIEWIRYNCKWDGTESGTEAITLQEPQGLHSGTWEIKIIVDHEVILQNQITVVGNWTYWDPAGTIDACHGTVR